MVSHLLTLLGTHLGLRELWRCVLLLCGVSVQALPAQGFPAIPDSARHAWLALLHYRPDDGGWLSEVDDPSFFLDADGRRDPEGEWSAARRAFLAPADPVDTVPHARCRFPARWALMERELAGSDDRIPDVECPELVEHERRIGATSLAVVFASYHLNNPASAFGHTLLYLGSEGERGAMLADYSVSFEADLEGLSPAQYLPRGLTGGLVAGYRVGPLYERIRRYEREEQRDLWMFPLEVSQEAIDQLVRHLWELRDVTFQYGFLGRNCAQKILAIVHAVAPEYEILPYESAAVLPSEVSRRLVDHIGLAGEPVRRPSLSARYRRLVAALSAMERERLESMVASRTLIEGASSATLSAALLWSELKTPDRAFRRAHGTGSQADLLWRRALWESRAARDDTLGIRGLTTRSGGSGLSLLQAHGPSRVRLAGGYRSGRGSVLRAGARWLLHEAVDPYAGYPPVSSIEVGRIDFGVGSRGALYLDEATAFRVERLAPASELESPVAWKLDLGARRLPQDAISPLHVGAEVGIGLGKALLRPRYSTAFYAMIGVRPGLAMRDGGSSFLMAGLLSGGFVFRLPADLRGRISGEHARSLGLRAAGGTAYSVVVRKGVHQSLDVEGTLRLGPEGSRVALGFVSFR